MAYIYSTLTAPQEYRGYRDGGDMRNVAWSVRIEGGANVPTKNMVTPSGVLTIVGEKEMELLRTNAAFNRHVERGFLVVEDKKQDVEKVTKNMKKKDESAPLTGEDFAPGSVEVNKA